MAESEEVMSTVNITVSRETLHNALARVAPAMSTEETRYYLNGVCLDWTKGALTLVATDGHRLHNVRLMASIDTGRSADDDFMVILPRSLVQSILQVAPKRREQLDDVTIEFTAFGEDRPLDVSVRMGQQTFSDKLIDGTFPDWRRVVPGAKHGLKVGLNLRYLESICKAAALGKVSQIILEVEPNDPESEREYTVAPLIAHDAAGGEYIIMPMEVDQHHIRMMKGRAVEDAA